jgi:exodeoxyribonuclease III
MTVVLSWNVTSWLTLLTKIKEQYGSWEEFFFAKHGADVVCLQEMKSPRDRVAAHPAEFGFGPGLKVDVFIACCHRHQRNGYNGVATIVRKGITSSVDAKCFGDKELDDEGRCLLTRHGKLSVFNVYVPAACAGAQLEFKMRFLEALLHKVNDERSAGQHVVVAGDLNISRRGIDTPKSVRRIDMALLAHCQHTAEHEAAILQALADVAVEELSPTSFCVTVGGKDVGRKSSSREDAEEAAIEFGLEETRFQGKMNSYVISPANSISIARFKEVVSVATPRHLTEPEVEDLVAEGMSNSPHCAVEWLEGLVGADGAFWDVWAEEQPLARCRATHWNQSYNLRYSNTGSRLDYILVDRELVPQIDRSGAALTSEAHALALATANNRWQPAREGIPDAADPVYDSQFEQEEGIRSARMVYFPPKWSDHIGVALTLPGTIVEQQLVMNPKTRHAQPHRSNPSIAGFLQKPQQKAVASEGTSHNGEEVHGVRAVAELPSVSKASVDDAAPAPEKAPAADAAPKKLAKNEEAKSGANDTTPAKLADEAKMPVAVDSATPAPVNNAAPALDNAVATAAKKAAPKKRAAMDKAAGQKSMPRVAFQFTDDQRRWVLQNRTKPQFMAQDVINQFPEIGVGLRTVQRALENVFPSERRLKSGADDTIPPEAPEDAPRTQPAERKEDGKPKLAPKKAGGTAKRSAAPSVDDAAPDAAPKKLAKNEKAKSNTDEARSDAPKGEKRKGDKAGQGSLDGWLTKTRN